MDLGNFNRHVLLTGAGFSKNWDGYLVSEFASALLSKPEIKTNARLKELCFADPSFESALYAVRSGTFSREDATSFELAIRAVFNDIEQRIDRAQYRGPSDINPNSVRKFLNCFYGTNQVDTGYFFTLNQDLLIEKRFDWDTIHVPPVSPGVPRFSAPVPPLPILGGGAALPYNFRSIDFVINQAPQLNSRFNYIKLHGSIDWRREDGSDVLVIGGGKTDLIAREPLLTWYSDVFKAVCHSGGIKLFISGYGFGDEHINRVIAEGVRDAKLSVYVNTPATYTGLLASLGSAPFGTNIRDGLIGHMQSRIADIFSGQAQETSDWLRIKQDFFE